MLGLYPTTWVSITSSGLFSASPNLQKNDTIIVHIEAYDGLLVSVPWTITIKVIYDPPVGDHLVDKKVRVG